MTEETKTVEPPADGTHVADALNGDGATPALADAANMEAAVDAVTEDQVEAAASGEATVEAAPAESEPSAAPQPEPQPEPDAPVEPAAHVEPDVPADLPVAIPAGPRTVGRYVADALRAAGVRYAFTVPGEGFRALLD